MAWSKPHNFQVCSSFLVFQLCSGCTDEWIDALEQVGNTGVNWNSLQTYVSPSYHAASGEEADEKMKRAENFQAPSSSQAAAGVTYNPSCHAANGPIGIQYDPNSYVLLTFFFQPPC